MGQHEPQLGPGPIPTGDSPPFPLLAWPVWGRAGSADGREGPHTEGATRSAWGRVWRTLGQGHGRGSQRRRVFPDGPAYVHQGTWSPRRDFGSRRVSGGLEKRMVHLSKRQNRCVRVDGGEVFKRAHARMDMSVTWECRAACALGGREEDAPGSEAAATENLGSSCAPQARARRTTWPCDRAPRYQSRCWCFQIGEATCSA